MNKLQTSFVKALLFTVASHLVSVITLLLLNQFEYEDFIYVLPITTSLFIIPTFLSYQFFDIKKKRILNYLKPAFISFFIINIIVYVFFRLIKKEETFSIFEIVSIMNGFIAFFISLFFTVIQLIKAKGVLIKNIDYTTVKYSLKKIVLIPLFGSIV